MYLVRRPVESVSNVQLQGKDYNYLLVNNYVELEFNLCQNIGVDITYTAGYKELPSNMMLLISELINNEIAALDQNGLKSYKIKDISYTFLEGLETDSVFQDKVFNTFGVY